MTSPFTSTRRGSLLAIGAACAWWLAATRSDAADALPRADFRFAEEASVGGMAEVEMAKLAQARGSHEEVKRFADRMVRDHTRAGEELKALVAAKSARMPGALPREHQSHLDSLGKLSGAEFDRAYAKMMVSAHEKMAAAFERQSRSGEDPALKAFAARTLPTVQDHLQAARSLNERVGR